jgi:hypothetical protein
MWSLAMLGGSYAQGSSMAMAPATSSHIDAVCVSHKWCMYNVRW